MKPGDTLYAREGVYKGNHSIYTGNDVWNAPLGSKNKPITFKAYQEEKVVFDGERAMDALFAFHENSDQWIVVDGITIQNYRIGIWILSPAKNIIIQNCTIKDSFYSHGIYVAGYSSTGAQNLIIRNNKFLNNNESGIQFNHGPTSAKNVKIYNNIFANPARQLILAGGLENCEISNNTFYNKSYHPTFTIMPGDHTPANRQGVFNLTIKNNIIYNTHNFGMNIPNFSQHDNLPEITSENNIWYNSSNNKQICRGNGYADNCPGSLWTLEEYKNSTNNGKESLAVNPGLIDLAKGDFHLRSDSKAIDAGTDISGLTTDIQGDKRPQGLAFDIGAYEYSNGSVAPPTDRYENLLEHRTGFGSKATGGAGGEVVFVTNLNDSGEGSLRSFAESSEKKWIRFSVSGTINLNSSIKIASNKTIDGRDSDITLRDYGVEIISKENIIVHNIKINHLYSTVDTDGVALRRVLDEDNAPTYATPLKDIWIDHVTVSNSNDELITITGIYGKPNPYILTDITVSWCEFFADDGRDDNEGKGSLIAYGLEDTYVTMHHNYWHNLYDRQPHVRHKAKIHYFNNYLYDWSGHNHPTWKGNGVHSRMGAEFAAENNIFEPVEGSSPVKTKAGNEEIGYYRSIGDRYVEDNNWELLDSGGPGFYSSSTNDEGQVFNPEDYYIYTVENADNKLREKIKKCAGWQTNPYAGVCQGVIQNNNRADVNGDGAVTATDALLTLKKNVGYSLADLKLIGWIEATTTGDVNCDGEVTASDAMLILKKAVGGYDSVKMKNMGWCV